MPDTIAFDVLHAARVAIDAGPEVRVAQREADLRRVGYALDERVDGAGAAAIGGEVIHIFPAGAETPIRLDHEDGRIVGMRRFNPVTQRTTDEIGELRLEASSEVVV